jgi:acetyl esterase/lipase
MKLRTPWLMGFAVVLLPAQATTQHGPVDRGVPYAVEAVTDQVMDVFWPSASPTAAVLFIHGGSLQESGERRASPMYDNVCTPFVAAAMVCASIDYRLAPTHQWPAMPNDLVSAIVELRRSLIARTGELVPLFLFGHSSGCHLAAVVATNGSFLEQARLSPKDIAGVIAMGCTLDRDDATVRRLTPDGIRAAFMREQQDVATYGSPENYLAANPASFVGPHVPPTLVVVAEGERFMPSLLEQGARFVTKLLENNVPANLVVVPGGHVSSITDVAKPNDPTFAAIRRFISDPRGSGASH